MPTCKACGQELIWATTTAGKKMPLDDAPANDGNVTLVYLVGTPGPTALVLGTDGAAQVRAEGRTFYRSHFSTCPKAGEFRRKKQ